MLSAICDSPIEKKKKKKKKKKQKTKPNQTTNLFFPQNQRQMARALLYKEN